MVAELEGMVPWEDLPDETRMDFGSNLAAAIGWMFPGMTFASVRSNQEWQG